MKFLFAYHGGDMPETEAETAKIMAAWEGWFRQLGPAVVDGGAPIGATTTVNGDGSTTDGGGANPVSGYTVVEANDLAAAADMAKGCPILEAGGSVEVGQAIDM